MKDLTKLIEKYNKMDKDIVEKLDDLVKLKKLFQMHISLGQKMKEYQQEELIHHKDFGKL